MLDQLVDFVRNFSDGDFVLVAGAIAALLFVLLLIAGRRLWRRLSHLRLPRMSIIAASLKIAINRAVALIRAAGIVALAAMVLAITLLVAVVYPLVGLAMTFMAGFAFTFIVFSPLYAIRSADAFEKGEEWLLIFVRRRPNRLMQRIKGFGSSGMPLDFVGIVPPGKNFKGAVQPGAGLGLRKTDPQYWELVPQDPSKAPAPTGIEINRFWIINLWMRYINFFSDVVLIGPRKLYDVYTYSLPKTRYKKNVLGGADVEEYDITPPDPTERSNHVRIAPFQWAVAIVGAETHDRLSWSLLVVVNVKSRNPWLTLHNHENWSQFLSSTLVDSLLRGLRSLTLEDIVGLTGDEQISDETRDKIIRPVYKIQDRLLAVVGIEFDQTVALDAPGYSGAVQLLQVEPRFRTDDDKIAFTQAWRARQRADQELILGEAEALRESTVTGAVAAEVAKHGEAGILTQRMQSLENAAASGKSTIIFETGESTSKVEKLLATLIDQRQKEKVD